jgi:hypothetical protein
MTETNKRYNFRIFNEESKNLMLTFRSHFLTFLFPVIQNAKIRLQVLDDIIGYGEKRAGFEFVFQFRFSRGIILNQYRVMMNGGGDRFLKCCADDGLLSGMQNLISITLTIFIGITI